MSNPSDIPKLLTTRQAAEALGRKPCYVRGLIRQGRLEVARLGDRGNWLIYADSLEPIKAALGVSTEEKHGGRRE